MTHVISNIHVHVSYHTWTLDQKDVYRGLYTVCEKTKLYIYAQFKMYGLIITIIINFIMNIYFIIINFFV